MKTTFRRKSNSAESTLARRALYIGLALVIGILIFYFLRSPLLSTFSPVWKGQNAVARGVNNFLALIRDKDALARENLALREELISYDALQKENRALESSRDEVLAQFGRAGGIAGIAAGVLVHPPETPYDSLIIDAGTAERVNMGDKVSLPEGGALGKISEVHDHQSKVSLYSESGIETQATLERGSIPVTLVGAGGGTFKMTLPRDALVEVGDKILLPGLRSELIGIVREVALLPTDSSKHMSISGVANIHGVRFVIVH